MKPLITGERPKEANEYATMILMWCSANEGQTAPYIKTILFSFAGNAVDHGIITSEEFWYLQKEDASPTGSVAVMISILETKCNLFLQNHGGHRRPEQS